MLLNSASTLGNFFPFPAFNSFIADCVSSFGKYSFFFSMTVTPAFFNMLFTYSILCRELLFEVFA